MSRIVASLAAVLASLGLAACGDDGAEPDAPSSGAAARPAPLELVLDFQPNAVHSGIYLAQEQDLLTDAGVALEVREPGASTDAPKLLRSGRADLAILDIHDLAIAREQGIELVGIGAVVQRPLAAVIAADGDAAREPADLEGERVGVTGLPSDDAVLESVLESAGLGLGDVRKTTIGFESVPALAGGELAAATAFWNAEGVALSDLDIPTREFRVDDFGAPRYPELVLVTTPEKLAAERQVIAAALGAIEDGYRAVIADPALGLDALVEAVPGLERGPQRRQLRAVLGAFGPSLALDPETLEQWAAWDLEHGIVDRLPDVAAAFDLTVAPG